MDVEHPINDGFLEIAYVLDEKFHPKVLIDSYTSFVWTERYIGYGEFELVMPVDPDVVMLVQLDDYLSIKESDVLMIIETMTLETDEETNGDTMTLTGRSLEAYLSRRIIWYDVEAKLSPQDLIKRLLDENAISPKEPKRVLTGLTFKASEDEGITSLEVEEFKMGAGDNLYESIETVCANHNIGFHVIAGKEGAMTFEMYKGVNRTWGQEKVAPVVFSAAYENLLTSNFVQSESGYASNALVRGTVGEDDTIMAIFRKPERVNLKRREVLIEVNDSEIKNTDQLFTKAKEEMSAYTVTVAFGSNVEPMLQFEYGRDYFIGDVVQVQNRYGFEGKCRVSEVTRSRDAAGPVLTPTFISVNDEGDEVKPDV